MSTRFRFTQKAIEQLPKQNVSAASKCAEYSDVEAIGLKLLVSKNGRKFFYARLSFNKQKYTVKLGDFLALSVADARLKVWQLRNDLIKGVDINKQAETIKVPTFAEFANQEYLPFAKSHKRSFAADISKLRVHLLPRFGHKRIDEVTFKELQQYHCEIQNSHCAATANRHLSLLSKMFSCAIDWRYIVQNPCKGIKKFSEQNSKERFLTSDEIRKLFMAMGQMKGKSDTAIAALKLLLLTGMRKNEVLQQHWQNVDLERGIWFVPKTKNGKAHHVVLNGEAKKLLLELHTKRNSTFVFPSRNPEKPLVELRRCLNQLVQIAEIKPLRVHDLRHSFASICAQSGVPLLQIKTLLNHANLSTTQRYMHLTDNNLADATKVVSDVIGKALNTHQHN